MIRASSLPGAIWRKSSYSGNNGGDCLEVADAFTARSLPTALWRKSSYSSDNGGDCLEVADGLTTVVPVRDSKNPHGPALVFAPTAWTAFVTAVRQDGLKD